MSKSFKTSFRSIIILNYFLFFSFFALAETKKCQFNENQNIYLFSGAMASMVYHLGLFDDPQIKGILSTYEFTKTKNMKFAGGIYLSQKLAEGIEDNAIIFHEESHDLEKTLELVSKRKKKNWQQTKIITKNKIPFEVSMQSLKILQHHLENSSACKLLVNNQIKKIQQLQERINNPKKNVMTDKNIYFFLGKWEGKFPATSSLVVFKEGFIQELIKNNYINAYSQYESQINYAPWSAKLLKEKSHIFIGINSEMNGLLPDFKMTKIDNKKFQITCFACLIPGIFQLEWLSELTTQWQNYQL